MKTTKARNSIALQRGCRRCGTCCRKGGPSLHRDDLALIEAGIVRIDDLLCIRKGEPAANPRHQGITPADQEYLKIAGTAGSWQCLFFTPAPTDRTEEMSRVPGKARERPACRIHATRPRECRLLECWAPEALLAEVGINILTRADLVAPGMVAWELIARQEEGCSFVVVNSLLARLDCEEDREEVLTALTALIARDLAIRQEGLCRGVAAGQELFLFGRPLFVCLMPFGITTSEERGRLTLRYSGGYPK